MKKLLLAALAALAFAGAAAAETMEIRVPVKGVDFADAVQVDRAHRAVVRAAERICIDRRIHRGALEKAAEARCVGEIVDNAVTLSGRASLVALHTGLNQTMRYAARRPAPNADLAALVAQAAREERVAIAAR